MVSKYVVVGMIKIIVLEYVCFGICVNVVCLVFINILLVDFLFVSVEGID